MCLEMLANWQPVDLGFNAFIPLNLYLFPYEISVYQMIASWYCVEIVSYLFDEKPTIGQIDRTP